jgi:quinol monooxygenase YgiN/adenylate kinase family enzyme
MASPARPQLPGRIHILGASGSGTTSLAAAIAAKHHHRHLDTDDFFWLATSPPYRERRPQGERVALLRGALGKAQPWVLSGSLCGWGDPLIPEFELVVFLVVPTAVRLARLRAREIERYGREAIAAGWPLNRAHVEFLEWAASYDTGGLEMRSRALHEAWLAALARPLVRLEGDVSVAEQLARLEANVAPSRGRHTMELFIFERFHARPGDEGAVANALHDVVAPTREEPGCLSIHAFRSIQDPRLFYIHSRWKDEAAFDLHGGKPHTIRFVRQVEPLIDPPFDATRTERIG